MITFDQVRNTAQALAEKDVGHTLDDDEFVAIVHAVITALDLHVDASGNICDPRPAPPIVPPQTSTYSRYSRPRRRR